ncbi:hypothetical protein B0H11DRAFT_1704936 [Mycena galericulata]|nr:hypothetical protein B0H11DRAFT_1704936 [Mycena galericulata]
MNREGWGRWMVDGYAVLSGCAGGVGWDAVVRLWTALERAYGFATSSKALPTTERPAAIGAWTKSGRRPTKPPPLDVEKFEKEWWAWWTALAPDWRQKDEKGRLVEGGEGEWGVLVHPGANGVLMVLLGLAWWRDKEEVATASWLAAVADARWVLSGLLAEAR